MSRILITGSTGFIGSAVLRQALAAGHEVGVLLGPDMRHPEPILPLLLLRHRRQ
jgi:nucleoside-diphosphate-sugar epimerase